MLFSTIIQLFLNIFKLYFNVYSFFPKNYYSLSSETTWICLRICLPNPIRLCSTTHPVSLQLLKTCCFMGIFQSRGFSTTVLFAILSYTNQSNIKISTFINLFKTKNQISLLAKNIWLFVFYKFLESSINLYLNYYTNEIFLVIWVASIISIIMSIK